MNEIKQTELSRLTECQTVLERLKPLHDMGWQWWQEHGFEPDVKGDIRYSNVEVLSILEIDDWSSVFSKDYKAGKGDPHPITLITKKGKENWRIAWRHFCPTLDQMFKWILAFNERQDDCYDVEIFLKQQEIVIFYKSEYTCLDCEGNDVSNDSPFDHYLELVCNNDNCESVNLDTCNIESKTELFNFSEASTETLSTACASAIAKCVELENGGQDAKV